MALLSAPTGSSTSAMFYWPAAALLADRPVERLWLDFGLCSFVVY
jgi:hypothetical protein